MKAAVVLAGCGYLDGAEIREATLSLLYLDQQGVKATCYAPDIPQSDVINHLKSEEVHAQRNVREEAARIARGAVEALPALNASEYDLLVLPGGFGVAKTLSDFAAKGADCEIHADYAAAIEAFYAAEKPIVAICIAPAILAGVLHHKGIHVTIGDDASTASAIEAFGNVHHISPTSEAVVDEQHKVISCSAYMREDPIAEVAKGIESAIHAAVRMAHARLEDAA